MNQLKPSKHVRCVFCNMPADTEEHVPPRSFFRKGTVGLITVPSCYKCNNGKSKDDEHLRNLMALSTRDEVESEFSEQTQKALRSLERSEKYLDNFLRHLSVESEDRVGMDVDHVRFERSIQAIAIGMMHHVFPEMHFGQVIRSRFMYPEHMKHEEPEIAAVLRVYDVFITQTQPRIVGQGEFTYYHSSLTDDQGGHAAVWAFHFFKTHWWIGSITLEGSRP